MFDKHVDKLTPQENTSRMMTILSDFQVTQIEERHTKIKSDVKEYVLALAEVCKILNEVDLDEVTREKLIE